MTADIQAAVERLSQSRDRARETAKRGDIFDPNPQLAAVAIEASNYANAVDTVLAALAEANEARSILQQAVLERTAERDEARRQIAERDEALTEAAQWHDSRNDDLGKQPPTADINWRRMEHREERDRIRALLASSEPAGEAEAGNPVTEQNQQLVSSQGSGQRGCGSRDEASAPATAALAKAWEDEVGRVSVERGDPLFSVWDAIGKDVRLRVAREKLSAHEITLIVGHARATAPVHEQGEG